jgi:hypothetical protein
MMIMMIFAMGWNRVPNLEINPFDPAGFTFQISL